MRTATGSVYYLTDHQGSVIGMVNDQGQKVAGYAYTPYGETRAATGTAADTNPYRFTSGYLDTTSNLHKLGYRYYDTRQGRFTPQDPSGQETNPYLYAGGDPINNADPSGLKPGCDLSPDSQFGTDFRPACATHDICYSASSTTDRQSCDSGLRADLQIACIEDNSSFKPAAL